jgi:hypothetical protein
MRIRGLLLALLTVAHVACGGVNDPVADHKRSHGLGAANTLYRMDIDINGDGRNEVLLCLKASYLEDKHDGQVPSWDVYLADAGASTYSLSLGLDDGEGVSPVLPRIDPSDIFIGKIEQLNKRGLVTVQTDFPKKGHPVRYIYAYTVEGSHLKETLLTKYNPD